MTAPWTTDRMPDLASTKVIVKSDTIISRINLTGIVRGPFQSVNVGYWVDKEHVGQGLASVALENVINHCIKDLGLHRLQTGTLLHNLGSQKILRKAGFEPIGIAKKVPQDCRYVAGPLALSTYLERVGFPSKHR